PVGRVCLFLGGGLPHCFGNFIARLRTTNEILSEYLFYFLWHFHALGKTSNYQKQTTGIRNLELKRYLTIEVPVPPIPEQRRIVDILSRAEGIVRLRREAQKKAAEVIPALFLDMFGDPATNPKGWPMHRLGDLAVKMSDGPFGSNLKTAHYTEYGVRVIRLQNIGVGKLNDEDQVFVSPEHFASLPRHHCLPRDVVIATLGDPNLRAIVLPSTILEALNKADCVQFRCKPELVTPEFICWLMNAPTVLNMAASIVQGITRTRISMGRLRELIVPMPPVALQRRFAERVDEICSIQTQQAAATQKAEATFDALLAHNFSG
ncbi:MAG: restriction endonuclease subunit S, partial [Methylococcales bacterium]